MMKQVNMRVLKTCASACGFESHYPHQNPLLRRPGSSPGGGTKLSGGICYGNIPTLIEGRFWKQIVGSIPTLPTLKRFKTCQWKCEITCSKNGLTMAETLRTKQSTGLNKHLMLVGKPGKKLLIM